MANFHYFSDCADGSSVELSTLYCVMPHELDKLMPGVAGVYLDRSANYFIGAVAEGEDTSKAVYFEKGFYQGKHIMVCTRKVQFKSNPKLHECNPKCMGATKHICECRCRGKNHGHC